MKHALLVTNVRIKLTQGMSLVRQKLNCFPHNLKKKEIRTKFRIRLHN